MNSLTSATPESDQSPEALNLLLEGITLASSNMEFFRLLPKNPFGNKTWLSQRQDITQFRTYLSSVIAPTSHLVEIGLAIHTALKTAAYQLNPSVQNNRIAYFSPSHTTTAAAISQTTPCGVVILGPTATGKTHALVAALGTIPQTIERTGFPNMATVRQITWIRLDMSGIASIEALAEQIIRAIDDALDAQGKIHDETLAGARGATTKMERALRLMKTYYVTMLVVDEIQAKNFAKPQSSEIRFWFLRIANQKIALIFSGNPLGFEPPPPPKKPNAAHFATQEHRRLFASNRIRIDPAESIDDPDWNRLVRTLARCHLDGNVSTLNWDMEKIKHQLTGGFPDFYVALHCELEKLRASNPRLVEDEDLIKKAAKASSLLEEMQPLITAFANRDPIALRKFTDVDRDYYDKKWRELTKPASADADVQTIAHDTASSMPEIDALKTIEAERKRIERKGNKKRAEANQPTSPTVADVMSFNLDQIGMLIRGESPCDVDK